MNTFEDPGFDAGDVVSVKDTLSEFERKVRREVALHYLTYVNANACKLIAGELDFVDFKDEAEMVKAYWEKVLG